MCLSEAQGKRVGRTYMLGLLLYKEVAYGLDRDAR